MFHTLHVLGINDDFLDRVRGVGSKTWKGCEWSQTWEQYSREGRI